MGLTGPCSDWRGTIKPLHLSLPLSHPVMIQERLGLEKGFSQQECPEDGWGEAPCDTSDSDSVSRSVMSDFLDPMSCSLPGSSVHGILQTRILEWAAIPFSRGSSQSRMEPRSPTLQAESLPSDPPGKPMTPLRPVFNIESSSNAIRAPLGHKLSRHWRDWGSRNEKAPNPSLTHTFQSTPQNCKVFQMSLMEQAVKWKWKR